VFRYLGRFREVLNAFRTCRTPGRLISAYLGLPWIRYPFTLRLRPNLEVEVRDLYEVITVWVVFCRQEYNVPTEAAVILDLGANLGMFSLFAAMHAPGARIVALEPYPQIFTRLVENIRTNGLADRVTCWNRGVMGRTGQVHLQDPATLASPSSSHGLPPVDDDHCPSTLAVEVSDWSDLMRRLEAELGVTSIDLVKMDIEGHEYEVLLAARPADLAGVAMWVMEVHNNRPREIAFRVLEAAGLVLTRDVDDPKNSGVAWFSRPSG
jgi:FkbM family methyltransferase